MHSIDRGLGALAAPPIFTYILFGDGSWFYPWFSCRIHSAPQIGMGCPSLAFCKKRLNLQNNKYLVKLKLKFRHTTIKNKYDSNHYSSTSIIHLKPNYALDHLGRSWLETRNIIHKVTTRSSLPITDLKNDKTHITLRVNPDRNVCPLCGHRATQNGAGASSKIIM
jgi:hypothetical protein